MTTDDRLQTPSDYLEWIDLLEQGEAIATSEQDDEGEEMEIVKIISAGGEFVIDGGVWRKFFKNHRHTLITPRVLRLLNK